MIMLLLPRFLNFQAVWADGKTRQEAIKNVEVIIKEWIDIALEDGETIPEPKGKLLCL